VQGERLEVYMQFTKKQVETIKSRINTLEKLATMLASKGVNVVWGGNSCYTNGKTVNIAGFDPEKILENRFYRKVLAFIAHEAFHPRYGMDGVNYTQGKPDVWHSMLNVVEDGRINTAGMREYLGIKSVLRDGYESLLEEGSYESPTAQHNPAAVLTGWAILNVIAYSMGFEKFVENEKKAREVAAQVFTPGFVNRADVLLSEVPSVPTSFDGYLLVEKIMSALDEELEEKKKEESKQQAKQRREQKKQQQQSTEEEQQSGQQDQDAEQSGGQSSSNSQDEQDDQPTGGSSGQNDAVQDTDSEDDQQTSSKQQSEKTSNASEQQSKGTGADDSIPSAKEVIKALNRADQDDAYGDPMEAMKQLLDSEAHETGSVCLNKKPPIRVTKGDGQITQPVKSKAFQLGQRIRAMVQSINEVPMTPGFVGDELMVQNLARMPYGESRLFVDTVMSQAPNVAFHVLLDNSGSMSGEQIKVAKESVVSTMLAIETIPGASCALTVFPAQDGSGYHSAVVYKQHHEKARVAATRLDSSVRGTGGTPLTEAMGVAIEDLRARKELRKVMLIVTDGNPDDTQSCIASYKMAKLFGMEVYGIGIFGSFALPRFTDSYQVIHSLDELPIAMQNITKNSTLVNLQAA
jgi:hypothetical protein